MFKTAKWSFNPPPPFILLAWGWLKRIALKCWDGIVHLWETTKNRYFHPRKLSTATRRLWRHQIGFRAWTRESLWNSKQSFVNALTKKAGWLIPLLTIIGYVIFVYFSRYFDLSLLRDTESYESFLSGLWQVEAGVLGVVFSIVILLVELRASKEFSNDPFQFIIRKSRIVPTAIFGLVIVGLTGLSSLALAQFSWASTYVRGMLLCSMVAFLLFIFFNIKLYMVVIELSNPAGRLGIILEAIKQDLRICVPITAQRIINQQVWDESCRNNSLYVDDYDLLRRDLEPIETKKTGRVVDIDLRYLGKFAAQLEHTVATNPMCKALMMISPESRIVDQNNTLARINKNDFDKHTIRLLQQAIKIRATDNDPYEKLISSIGSLKEEASENLQQHRVGPFEKNTDTYFHVFESLLELWSTNKIRVEILDSPIGALWRGPIFRLIDDLKDILKWAIETKNQDVIDAIMYLPIRILRLIIRTDEHKLFFSLAETVTQAYFLVVSSEPSQIRTYVVDRSWRYLQEFSEWVLVRDIHQDTTLTEQLSRLSYYLIELINIFNSSLKAATDYLDTSSFKEFGQALDSLLEHLDLDQEEKKGRYLQWFLENEQLSPDKTSLVQAELERAEILSTINKHTQQTVQKTWFGLSAWLLRKLRRGGPSPDKTTAMLDAARNHFADFEELSSLYFWLTTHRDSQNVWEIWISFENPPGKAHFIDVQSWLRDFYCYQGLFIPLTDNSISNVNYQKLESENTAIKKAIDGLETGNLLNDTQKQHIDAFLAAHEDALSKATHSREQRTVEQAIDREKVEIFKQGFVEGWPQKAFLRTIINEHGKGTESISDSQPVSLVWTYSQSIEKSYFVNDSEITYAASLGSAISDEIARIENIKLYSRMLKDIQIIECSHDQAESYCKSSVQKLVDEGYNPNLMLTDIARWDDRFNSWLWELVRSNDVTLKAQWGEYLATLADIPMLDVSTGYGNEILVADFHRWGHIVQYVTENSEQFSIFVDPIDKEKATQLAQDDQIAKNLGLSGDELIWKLQQKVQIHISEVFDFQVDEPEAAVLIRVIEAPNTESAE